MKRRVTVCAGFALMLAALACGPEPTTVDGSASEAGASHAANDHANDPVNEHAHGGATDGHADHPATDEGGHDGEAVRLTPEARAAAGIEVAAAGPGTPDSGAEWSARSTRMEIVWLTSSRASRASYGRFARTPATRSAPATSSR